jgi:hypothetical protein
MHPVFEIIPENIEGKETNLVCEISEQGMSFVLQNAADKEVRGLVVYRIKTIKEDLLASAKSVFNDAAFLKKNYNKVDVSYSFSENVLLPDNMNSSHQSEALSLLFGDSVGKKGLVDQLDEKKMVNAYRVPMVIHDYLKMEFPLASFEHQYSFLVKQLKGETYLQSVFYPNKMVVMLAVNGELQLVNSFYYATKEDAAYHLLSIKNQYKLDDVNLELSGMIEEDSPLYKEIHKYFLNCSFQTSECRCTEEISKYPSHYFSHLFSLASCV